MIVLEAVIQEMARGANCSAAIDECEMRLQRIITSSALQSPGFQSETITLTDGLCVFPFDFEVTLNR